MGVAGAALWGMGVKGVAGSARIHREGVGAIGREKLTGDDLLGVDGGPRILSSPLMEEESNSDGTRNVRPGLRVGEEVMSPVGSGDPSLGEPGRFSSDAVGE